MPDARKCIDQHGFRRDRRGHEIRDELLLQVGPAAARARLIDPNVPQDGEQPCAKCRLRFGYTSRIERTGDALLEDILRSVAIT